MKIEQFQWSSYLSGPPSSRVEPQTLIVVCLFVLSGSVPVMRQLCVKMPDQGILDGDVEASECSRYTTIVGQWGLIVQ